MGLADLEQYDKVFAHHLRDLLITKEDVSTMGLDFSDLMDGGKPATHTSNDHNPLMKLTPSPSEPGGVTDRGLFLLFFPWLEMFLP